MMLCWMMFVALAFVAAAGFFTLLERKVLSLAQTRVGPTKSGYWGILNPMADGLKLLGVKTKGLNLTVGGVFLFMGAVLMSMCLPSSVGSWSLSWTLLCVFCASTLMTLAMTYFSWESKSKWGVLGAFRGLAQLSALEGPMLSLVVLIMICGSFAGKIQLGSSGLSLGTLWPVLVSLAVLFVLEASRAPWDFIEGESELVSGFNTEAGSKAFALLFVSEYFVLGLFSCLISIMILNSSVMGGLMMMAIAVLRALFPRPRLDVTCIVMWNYLLPVSLILLFLIVFH